MQFVYTTVCSIDIPKAVLTKSASVSRNVYASSACKAIYIKGHTNSQLVFKQALLDRFPVKEMIPFPRNFKRW